MTIIQNCFYQFGVGTFIAVSNEVAHALTLHMKIVQNLSPTPKKNYFWPLYGVEDHSLEFVVDEI